MRKLIENFNPSWGAGAAGLLSLTLRKAIFEKIPYSMGWWAFTFPLGAYTLATRLVFAQTHMPLFTVIFWILLVNLVVFSLLTAYRTVVSVVQKT